MLQKAYEEDIKTYGIVNAEKMSAKTTLKKFFNI